MGAPMFWGLFVACAAMVAGYANAFGLDVAADELRAGAIEWSVTRGGRSGRVAWQYAQDLAGKLGKRLEG